MRHIGRCAADDVLRVGSKRFTESYILGEVLTQTAAAHGKAEHRQGLGNTAIVLAALQAGSIDVYPEYLGTIDLEILKNDKPTSLAEMRAALARIGLGVGVPLGFNNTYALAMRGDSKGVATLSELAAHPELQARAVARIHRPRRRLAGAGQALWPAAAAARARSRHRLRGAGAAPGRRHRHLFDRRQDPPVRPAPAGRRPALLPALRRGAAVPARCAGALSGSLARHRAAGGAHPGRSDDRDERGGGTGRARALPASPPTGWPAAPTAPASAAR